MTIFALGALLMADSALPVVLAGKVLFGLGLPWIVVAMLTLLQRSTPPHLQGRAFAASELALGAPQTLSIALGAALVALVDYRVVLLVQAATVGLAGVALLTRMHGPWRPWTRTSTTSWSLPTGEPRAARPHARRGAGGARPRGADRGRPPPRRDLHAAGDHVRRRRARRRPGARPPVPARPRPADHPRERVDDDQARPRAADPRAQPLRRRRLPRARDHPRRQGAVGAGRQPARLRPRRARHPPARRRLLPRLRLRPRARQRRRLEGARGQRPHAVRHLATCSRTGAR